MKITIVGKKVNANGGGSDRSLHLIANKLEKRGHDITVITCRPNENNIPKKHLYTLTEESIDKAFTPIGEQKKLLDILNRHEMYTDVYHIFDPNLMTSAGLYRLNGGPIPIICRLNTYTFCTNLSKMDKSCFKRCSTMKKFFHDDENKKTKRFLKTPFEGYRTHFKSYIVNNIDKFSAISPTIKDIYTYNGIQNNKIQVIPNFYDPSFPIENQPTEKNSDSEYRILYVGRLVKHKGLENLIRSINLFNESLKIKVDIIGDGSNSNHLRNLVRQLRMEDRIKFHGHIEYENLSLYYHKADVFVHPGLWPEPFGRTLIEALQHDCPAIVSDIGAPPWVVGDAGEVFNRNSPADLAETIKETLDNYTLYRDECKYELQRFEPESILNQLETHYHKLAEIN